MPPLISVPPRGQQRPQISLAQNEENSQQRTNRNCLVCGDMANGFNLNVPRYGSFIIISFIVHVRTDMVLMLCLIDYELFKNISTYIPSICICITFTIQLYSVAMHVDYFFAEPF